MTNKVKECTDCKKVKTVKDFYKNSSSPDGYRSECKACTKARRSGNGNGTITTESDAITVFTGERPLTSEQDNVTRGDNLYLVKGVVTVVNEHYHGADRCYICNSLTSYVCDVYARGTKRIRAVLCHNCVYSIDIDSIRVYAFPNGELFFMLPVQPRKVRH